MIESWCFGARETCGNARDNPPTDNEIEETAPEAGYHAPCMTPVHLLHKCTQQMRIPRIGLRGKLPVSISRAPSAAVNFVADLVRNQLFAKEASL